SRKGIRSVSALGSLGFSLRHFIALGVNVQRHQVNIDIVKSHLVTSPLEREPHQTSQSNSVHFTDSVKELFERQTGSLLQGDSLFSLDLREIKFVLIAFDSKLHLRTSPCNLCYGVRHGFNDFFGDRLASKSRRVVKPSARLYVLRDPVLSVTEHRVSPLASVHVPGVRTLAFHRRGDNANTSAFLGF